MSKTFMNGIYAIRNIISSYEELKSKVLDKNIFFNAAKVLLQGAYSLNQSLQEFNYKEVAADKYRFAYYREPLNNSEELLSVLATLNPDFVNGSEINIPLELFIPSFAITIESDNENDIASDLAQEIAVKVFGSETEYDLRCIDLCDNGKFFDSIFTLANKMSDRFGGRIFVSKEEYYAVLKESKKIIFNDVEKMSGDYESVLEYNQNNKNGLISYLYIFNIASYSNDEIELISKLMKTRHTYGMSFIVVGNASAVSNFKKYADFNLVVDDNSLYLDQLPYPVEVVSDEHNIVTAIEESIQTAAESEIVDTLYENNPSLHMPYLEMNSSSILRIPFAINRDGSPLYLEIGGDAPTHMLMSGSTGSGKSVALHSIIMQIVANYHPDDVEIWAIDYKAVEFDEYMTHRTPHFRVVAHDTSVEFSLSLLDLLYEEYESRMKKFLDAKVKNIKEYRKYIEKKGKKDPMPRIIVVIDEFQIMTQAVQNYSGDKNYKTILENLLKLTRAMGISFVLCSQTISSGLSGLTESARDQIGCRVCLKHDDPNEISATLVLNAENRSAVVQKAINLRRGQGIYKRVLLPTEPSVNGSRFEFLDTNVIYINDKIKYDIIESVNKKVGNDYTPKKEIFVKGSARIHLEEKSRHPISKFLEDGCKYEAEGLAVFPAAPANLNDYYSLNLENSAGANILMVGENDSLRDSVILHSVMSCLFNEDCEVVVNIINETNHDRARLVELLKKIKSPRLELNIGIDSVLVSIEKLKSIRQSYGKKKMYFWYGLDKIKNELFLMAENNGSESVIEAEPAKKSVHSEADVVAMIRDFGIFTKMSDDEIRLNNTKKTHEKTENNFSLEDCQKILLTAFDMGPENDLFHFAVFNNYKAMKKSGFIKLDCFENILGTRMTTDDAHNLFTFGTQIEKADDNTIVYGNGGRNVTPLRPYLIPKDEWFDKFNSVID